MEFVQTYWLLAPGPPLQRLLQPLVISCTESALTLQPLVVSYPIPPTSNSNLNLGYQLTDASDAGVRLTNVSLNLCLQCDQESGENGPLVSLGPKSQAAGSQQWWKFKRPDVSANPATGSYTIIALQSDETKVLTAPNPVAGGHLSVQQLATPELPGQLWHFSPFLPYPPGAGSSNKRSNYTHVIDYCCTHWHNPACNGNPTTWHGCTASGSSCTCVHY